MSFCFGMLKAIASEGVPLLRRAVEAQERSADAASLTALWQYRAHINERIVGHHASSPPPTDRAGLAVLDATIDALGRRLAIRAAAGGA
jgi:hypothetical protein